MQPSRYRFGIIGFGNRGKGHYRNLTRNFGDRVEVVAVADPRFAREAAGSETPGHVYANYHDLLASPDVDAVVIATHESAHVDASIAAMKAGKVVLLEKAVAPSWPEAVRLYRYVKSSGRPFKVALNLRHMPAAKVLREVLASNTIGRVVAATIHVNAGSDWGSSCFRRFYANSELCGDLVLSKLTHDTDLVHHLLGTRANQVTGVVAKTTYIPKPGAGTDCDHCAITAECTEYVDLSDPALRARNDALLAQGQVPLNICPYTRPSTSHDTASFTGTFESGAVYTFVFTTAGPVYERRYSFNGTAGQVSAVLHGPEGASVVVHKTRHTPEVVPIPDEAGGHGGADPSMMASFLAYLDTMPSAPDEPEAILTSVLIPLGGLTSAASGQAMDLAAWYRDAST